MMTSHLYLEEVAMLRSTPTIERWSAHLKRLRKGAFEDRVRSIGGIEDYIGTILVEADDPPLSESLFLAALKEEIQGWVPSALDLPAEVLILVELIAAYRPSIGFVKIFAKMQDPKQARLLVQGDVKPARDVRRKMLNTLDSYFAAAQPGGDQAYRDYIRLLNLYLLLGDDCSSYAGLLLFRKGRLTLKSKKALDLVRRSPLFIGLLLRDITDKYLPEYTERTIGLLYNLALRAGEEAWKCFQDEVLQLGGDLDLRKQSLVLPSVGVIRLGMPHDTESEARLLRIIWTEGQGKWSTSLASIRRQAAEQKKALDTN